MTRFRLLGPQLLLLLLAVLLLDNVVGYAQQAAKLHPRRIAIWGSSVANGRGSPSPSTRAPCAFSRSRAARMSSTS